MSVSSQPPPPQLGAKGRAVWALAAECHPQGFICRRWPIHDDGGGGGGTYRHLWGYLPDYLNCVVDYSWGRRDFPRV